MADAATTADAVRTDAGADHSFLWRRLHSLSGVLPLGAFLCYHVFENLSALRGPAAYDEMVNHVNTMLPRALLLRAGAGDHRPSARLPRALRRLGGGDRASRTSVATPTPATGATCTQRITGVIALLFLVVHVGTLRTWVTLLGNHLAPMPPVTAGGLDLVTYRDVAAHLGNPASLGRAEHRRR